MIKIPKKIDFLPFVFFWAFLLFFSYSIYEKNYFFIILDFSVLLFFCLFFLSIRYFILSEKLVIKFLFKTIEIDIKKIEKIRNVDWFFLDKDYTFSYSGKIKIFFKNEKNLEDFVIISVKNKQKFLENLADINNDIDLDL